jgi:hypothetical protein
LKKKLIKLKLIPLIDALDLPNETRKELNDNEIYTHHEETVNFLNWDESHYLLKTKQWLIKTYDKDIKKYNYFRLLGT